MPLLDHATLKQLIERLATTIAAPPASLPTIETFSPIWGDARPHLDVDADGYHYIVSERGREREHLVTRDLDALLYRVFVSITSDAASHYELRHRRPHEDSRRVWFRRQVELLGQLNTQWAERQQAEHDAIVQRYPFDDLGELRRQLYMTYVQHGYASPIAQAMAERRYPRPHANEPAGGAQDEGDPTSAGAG